MRTQLPLCDPSKVVPGWKRIVNLEAALTRCSARQVPPGWEARGSALPGYRWGYPSFRQAGEQGLARLPGHHGKAVHSAKEIKGLALMG